MQSLGNHLIVELYNCDAGVLNDTAEVETKLLAAAEMAGANVVQSVVHKFNPHGVSGVVVIEESHFSVHTWPEYGYCALDIFTCGEMVDNATALEYLVESFQAESYSVNEIRRGFLNLPVKLLHKPDAVKKNDKNAALGG